MHVGASSGHPGQPSRGAAILSPVLLKPPCVFAFGCAESSLLRSPVVQSGGSSLVAGCGLLMVLAFPAAERGLQGAGISSAAFLLSGPRRQTLWLWYTGLVAAGGTFPGQGSTHVPSLQAGSSQARDQTRVPAPQAGSSQARDQSRVPAP